MLKVTEASLLDSIYSVGQTFQPTCVDILDDLPNYPFLGTLQAASCVGKLK
jgi:hypothetical protein